MDKVHLRLQLARQKAGFETATDAARAYGWNENTYRSHENGERGIRASKALLYAEKFQVSLNWLISGKGDYETSNVIQVTGLVLAEGDVSFYPADELNMAVDIPIDVPSLAVCCMVDGPWLWPRYGKGDLILTWNTNETDNVDVPMEVIAEIDGTDRCKIGIFIREEGRRGQLDVLGSTPLRNVAPKIMQQVQAVIRNGTYEAFRPAGVSKVKRS